MSEHHHIPTGWRAAIYYRVSSPGQVDAFGYDAQKRILPEYASRVGWTIADHYEEPGLSGESLLNRPGMQRLLADGQRGLFDVILVVEDTRLSRGELRDWEYIKAICDDNEISLATPSGVFYRPHNEDDDFLTDIRGAMSKREKKQIQARMARGKQEALQQGRLIHSTAPFGYRFVRYGRQASEKRLEIVEEQADVVRLIYQLAAVGDGASRPMGITGIARHLNEVLHTPSPRSDHWGRENGGGPVVLGHGRWSISSVLQLIRNGVYSGRWHFGAAPGAPRKPEVVRPGRTVGRERPMAQRRVLENPEVIPAIVSAELWQAANDAVSRRNRNTRGRPCQRPHRPLLSGFLRCPHCGYGMNHYATPYTAKGGEPALCRRYVCSGRMHSQRFNIERCDNQRWSAEVLESAVWEKVRGVLLSPELLESLVEDAGEELPPAAVSELPLIERGLGTVDAAAERVKAAYRSGIYSLAELETELGKIRQEREALENRLSDIQHQVDTRAEWEQRVADAIDTCREFQSIIDHADPSERRNILQDLVEEITIDRDGKLTLLMTFGNTVQARVHEPAEIANLTSACHR